MGYPRPQTSTLIDARRALETTILAFERLSEGAGVPAGARGLVALLASEELGALEKAASTLAAIAVSIDALNGTPVPQVPPVRPVRGPVPA